NTVVLSVGAVVLGQLDAVALDMVDLADLRAARGVDFHVLTNVGRRADRPFAFGQRCACFTRMLCRHLDTPAAWQLVCTGDRVHRLTWVQSACPMKARRSVRRDVEKETKGFRERW